jgi:hypothetical protein
VGRLAPRAARSLAQARTERDELQAKLSEADDTVAALRQSLKQMMRDQSI